MHLDPALEQDPQPAQAGRTLGVAQHRGAHRRAVAWIETNSGPSRSVSTRSASSSVNLVSVVKLP